MNRTRRCGCHDPVVFGHHCNRRPPTFNPGQTFTSNPIGIIQTIREGETAHRALTQTTWNWKEITKHVKISAKLLKTRENL